MMYIVVILGGMLTTIAYNGCAGFLRAMGNSRTPLYFLILSSLLNLALDALFVIALHTGIAGTALATVIAQAVSAALCGTYIFRNYREYLPRTSDWKIGRELSAEMFTTGFSMAMMQCVFSLGSVVLPRSINALNTDIITAHTASRRVYEMLMIPMSTVSSTIELVVKIISAAVLVPAIGYLGVAVTEPVIWCLCALFLAVFYVTIGHQKQSEERNV